MSSRLTVPIAIVVGGLIVAGAVYFSTVQTPFIGSGDGNPALVRPISVSDHILGNPAARVMIIEYSDFDCTYCKDFHETLHQIIADAGTNGEVAWVFRHFPLSEIHPNALSHARAAECAAQIAGNDAFWRFADALFKNQPANPSRYGEFAQAAGISGDAFAACYAGNTTTLDARIMADRQNALLMGTDGTPYSLIVVDDKPPIVMAGGYSFSAVKELVDQALGQ